jgi:lipoprotein-anchoring transpeptidase ErfK/SrfK
MSSLRNFVVIVLLAGVLGVVYFAINKPPQSGERPTLAPSWGIPPGESGRELGPSLPSMASGASTNGGLPGFPSGSTLPGTSISSISPPSVTLPAAPAVSIPAQPSTATPYPTAAAPVNTSAMSLAQSSPQPAPTSLPSVQPAPPTPPAVSQVVPQAVSQSVPPAEPAAASRSTITGVGATGDPANAMPSAPLSSTVVLGQQSIAPQTVYPATSTVAAVPATPAASTTGPVGTAAPVSYYQTTPATAANVVAVQPSPSTPADPPGYSEQFLHVMRKAKTQLDAGQLSQALLDLTSYRNSARLVPAEARLLTELLDQLAGTVVYSRQHLLEPAYRVQPGDTLDRIAASYQVTPELLAKINGLRDTHDITPGSELKVVRGPFEAVVELGRYEMTLLVNGRYAGRFPVGIGRDRTHLEGVFVVQDKKLRPIYYGPNQTIVASEDPSNPLGGRLLNLGTVTEPWGIHGTDNNKNVGSNEGRGVICLTQRDIDDVYDILSVGSRVTIRR